MKTFASNRSAFVRTAVTAITAIAAVAALAPVSTAVAAPDWVAPGGKGDYLVTAPGGKRTVWASQLAPSDAAPSTTYVTATTAPVQGGDYLVTAPGGKRAVLASALPEARAAAGAGMGICCLSRADCRMGVACCPPVAP